MKFFVWGILLLLVSGVNIKSDTGAIRRLDPPTKIVEPTPRNGKWFMSASGKAIYCRGPIVRIGGLLGDMKEYATQCEGKAKTVQLHD